MGRARSKQPPARSRRRDARGSARSVPRGANAVSVPRDDDRSGSTTGGWFRRLPTAVQFLAAVMGLLATTLSVVFLIWPNLKPRLTSDERSASLAVTLDRPMTQRQYLALVRRPESGLSEAALDRRGSVVNVDAEIRGYEGMLPLRWILIDDDTGEFVADDDATGFEPEGSEPLTHPVWIDVPRSGRFRVRFLLYPPGADERPSLSAITKQTTEVFEWPPA